MGIIRKLAFIIITAMLTIFTYNFLKFEGIEISDRYEYSPIPSNVYYKPLTTNTGITQKEVVNNVWYNLQEEGYTLDSLKEDLFYVDLTFSKDSEIWRYIYDVESNYVMFFNNDYETSYTGETYINEGKENK